MRPHAGPSAPERNGAEGIPSLAFDPFDEEVLEHPYGHHAMLRDAGPVFHLEKHDVYGMARHSEVTAALKDWERFQSGRGVGLADFAKQPPWRAPSLLLETDPPLHDRMRRIMNGVVSLASLKAVQPRWRERARDLAETVSERRRVDAVRDIAEAFPLSVFPDTIGLMQEGREHLLPYAGAVFNAYGPRNRVWESTEEGLGKAVAWIDEACRRRNLAPDGWGMDVYRAADAGLCGEEDAHRLVRSFLSAGVDTTVNGIGNLLAAFVGHPGEWDRLRARPALGRRALEEGLRWDSTAQIFFRTTTTDVEVGGCVIPEGSKVMLFLAAANRDPRRWPDAETFDVGRLASGHVGFGFGIHQCLGQMVARQEAETLLEALAARVRRLRPAGPPVRRLNNSLRALASLPVEIEPA